VVSDSVIESREISDEEPQIESVSLANSIDDLIAKIKMKYEITDTNKQEQNVASNHQSDSKLNNWEEN
jgi:hypothetical protein